MMFGRYNSKTKYVTISLIIAVIVIWDRVYAMSSQKNIPGFEPGITSFDEYSSWDDKTGIDEVWSDGIHEIWVGEPVYLTDEELNNYLTFDYYNLGEKNDD